MNAATFTQNFEALSKSIRANNPKRLWAIMLPSYDLTLKAHEKASAEGTSCSCRVCYWAKGS